MSKRCRGLTVVEIMVVVSIFGVFGVIGIYLLTRTTSPFSPEDAAKEWAAQLRYSNPQVTCMPTANLSRVRCTVRVDEQAAPIPLECDLLSESCAMSMIRP